MQCWNVLANVNHPISGSEARLSVPASKMPGLVYETKKEMAKAGLLGTILGHVGDDESSLISVVYLVLQNHWYRTGTSTKIKRTIDPLNLFNPGKVGVDFSFNYHVSEALVNPCRCTLIHRRRLIRGSRRNEQLYSSNI